MSGEIVNTKRLIVYVQENGIIRDENDHLLIGRLVDSVKYAELIEVSVIPTTQSIGVNMNSVGQEITEYDKSIHSNPDARAWAEFYCKENPEMKLENIHGWFANAMMAMHNHIYQTKTVLEKEELVDTDDKPPKNNKELLKNFGEAYHKEWKHAIIHLNPNTGELHSDGDHSVRVWIQEKINGKQL